MLAVSKSIVQTAADRAAFLAAATFAWLFQSDEHRASMGQQRGLKICQQIAGVLTTYGQSDQIVANTDLFSVRLRHCGMSQRGWVLDQALHAAKADCKMKQVSARQHTFNPIPYTN
mmetsp:Transcript_28515/g.53540  ORF Transcript_28515/g.53540 Transcript_28515/m.53540 type:complete len:116 (-) Transcript_28515:165-512(-)